MARTLLSSAETALPCPPMRSLAWIPFLRDAALRRRLRLVVARTGDGQPIVVAGTDFERVRQLDRGGR